jgi:hypothetical protein
VFGTQGLEDRAALGFARLGHDLDVHREPQANGLG